jgi:hypothetical protein
VGQVTALSVPKGQQRAKTKKIHILKEMQDRKTADEKRY